MNKNVTYPKTVKCPTCHTGMNEDFEWLLQGYDFPSWIKSQCERCCGDFTTELEIEIKVKSGWTPVTDRLPEDGQECWTFRPSSPKNAPKMLTWKRRVGTHLFRAGKDGDAWWEGFGSSDYNHRTAWNQITHWQPFVRPEAPEVE